MYDYKSKLEFQALVETEMTHCCGQRRLRVSSMTSGPARLAGISGSTPPPGHPT